MLPHPPPPEGRRHALLSTILIITVRVIIVGAVLSLLLPVAVAEKVAVAVLVLLISVPIFRLGWFATRWFRRGDHRYAAVAIGLMCTIAAGATLNYFIHSAS